MPNLRPPLTTVAAALAYGERIRAALPAGADFTPLLTLYLTEATTAAELKAAKAAGLVGGQALPGRRHHAFGRRRAARRGGVSAA